MTSPAATEKTSENQGFTKPAAAFERAGDGGWVGAEQLPRQFGRLTLLRRLARGGMGEVYLAATRGIEGAERPCVVKTIREEHSNDKSFRARFLDETRIQAQLTHPGVVQILEAATLDDGRPYAVVEYVEGRHLGEVSQRSLQLGVRIDWADAVAVGISFADALAHIHERTDESGRPLGIAHRDLSPQNVMLGYGGDLKLIDFGTAKGENRRCRTVSGIVYAKPGYVAPEVASQIPGGPLADLYAFGVMVWELSSGRRFLQGDPVEHQARVATGELRLPPIAAQIGAPARFDELLAEVTHPDTALRTPSAKRAAKDLLALLKQAPSLADGDRSVRGRIALLMQKLYPAEPARSRADFSRRVAQARDLVLEERPGVLRAGMPEPSPAPAPVIEESPSLLAGTRYRLVRCLSQGGMGEVWEAVHVDLGRQVAVKVLPAAAAGSATVRARFKAEARALARLSHPGLVKVHDFGFALDGRPYYAMDLLSGSTLEARLLTGPLSWAETLRVGIEASEALAAAHHAGIVHRDISPSNLFLTDDGRVHLLDFGVAGSMVDIDSDKSREAPLCVGTPEYISPEQAAGAAPDRRSDLYALGVVLYEALTGHLPHPLGEDGSPSLAALLTAKITVIPKAPSAFVKDRTLPKRLDAVVLKMLERDAEKRTASAEEAAFALRALLPAERTPRRVPWVFVASAAAAVVGITFGARLLLPSEAPTGSPRTIVEAPVVLVAAAPTSEVPSVPGASPRAELADQPVQARPGEATEESPSPEARELAAKIERALTLGARGQKIAAHHQMRALAKDYPTDPKVLRGLVQTAKGVKAWGEALKANAKVVELDPTVADRLQKARLEHATLQGDAIGTLEKLLVDLPSELQAKQLLEEYRREQLASR